MRCRHQPDNVDKCPPTPTPAPETKTRYIYHLIAVRCLFNFPIIQQIQGRGGWICKSEPVISRIRSAKNKNEYNEATDDLHLQLAKHPIAFP